MKKLLIVLGMVFFLSGCGSKELKSLHCTVHSKNVIDGYEVNSTYDANGEKGYAKTVTSKEEAISESQETLDMFEETIKETYTNMNGNYGGYTFTVTRESNKVIADVTIDYSKMDLKKMLEDQPGLDKYIKDGKMKMSGLKAMYEDLGATCETK